jgi:phage terminase large subunit-like protein
VIAAGLPPNALASLSPADQAILDQWVAAELRRIQREPINNILPPHEGQEQLHESESRLVLLIAANRFGKSLCGMRDDIWCARGEHPYRRIRPHRVIWSGFPDFPFYTRVTKPMFDLLCPPEWIADRNDTEKWVKIHRKNGGTCTIFFMSYEAGRDKWQGASVDRIRLDEEPPEDIYKEGMARLIDTDGTMVLTLTPVSGMGWIYDRLYLPIIEGRLEGTVIEGALAEYDESQPYCIGRSLVPHLSREQIIRFAEAIPDEDERAIRIFGQFRSRSGGTYKQYRADIHVVPAFAVPEWWEAWGALDPGYHGFAALLLVLGDDGRTYVVTEYFSQGETQRTRLEALAERVKEIRPSATMEDPIVFFVDTADPQAVLELNIHAQDLKVPLVFTSLELPLKAVATGVTRVQQLLEPHHERSTPDRVRRPRPEAGEPMLYFFDTLKSEWRIGDEPFSGSRVLWEIARLLWQKKKGSGEVLDKPDEATAHGAHAVTALRYGIMVRLGAPDKPKEDKLKRLHSNDAAVHAEFQRLRDKIADSFDPLNPE